MYRAVNVKLTINSQKSVQVFLSVKFKVSIWPTGFCSFGISIMCKKVSFSRKMDSGILKHSVWSLALKFLPWPRHASERKKRVWVFKWVVTSSQELPDPTSSVHCCFSSGKEFSSTKNKQTEGCKAVRWRPASKMKIMKLWDVPEVMSFVTNLS